MDERDEMEVTMGTGRLLGLFFGMVVVCAIFFGLGFTLGHNSVSPPPKVAEAAAPVAPAALPSDEKPSAGRTAEAAESTPAPDQLTFYKAVEQPETEAKLTPPELPKPARSAAPASKPGPGYVVQVAAVTKQDDAEALINALRKKHYPVFLATSANDGFFRVQVGPFPDQAEAKAMKEKLAGDGYNAILKK